MADDSLDWAVTDWGEGWGESWDEDQDEGPSTKFDKIIETPDDSEGPLTFGIELEFLVPVIRNVYLEDPHPQDGRPPFRYLTPTSMYFDSAPQLLIRDLDDQIRNVLEKACDIHFRLEREEVWHAPHNNVPLYNECRLVGDETLEFIRPNRFGSHRAYEWVGKEITSDILRCDDPTFYTKRINDICRAIRAMRVHLNSTCGVHVHVGHGDESFSLLTMKKFSTLILLADELLLGLHHPSRSKHGHCEPLEVWSYVKSRDIEELVEDNRSLLTPSQRQQMNEFIPARFTHSQPRRMLQATTDITELVKIMGDQDYTSGIRGSMGFRRFLPAGKTGGNTHTFEFRQMAGCLDPEPILHWVRVCTAFTDFARQSSPEQYKELVDQIMDNESAFSKFDLLLALGLVQEERYFRQKVEVWGRGELGLYEGNEKGQLFVPKME